MQHRRRSTIVLALTLGASLVLAACGGDDDDNASATTAAPAAPATAASAAPATTTPSGGSAAGGDRGQPVDLKGVCPDTVNIQTDWMPEAEHGFLYQIIGDGYTIDKSKAVVTGPLMDRTGHDTGVKFSVHSGGAAQHFSPVTQLLYQDDSLLLGYVYTDEAIQFSGNFPTVAVESGYEKNPQMIMWDPATYPDVTGIADLGKKGVKIRYFGGAAYMDFLTGSGVLSKSQVDGSYQGDPSLFVADEGKSAQQGFGSAEPYLYEHEIEGWMKPVEYQYINDVGWKNYAESIATKPENVTKYKDCLAALVPIIQQSSVDYINDPTHANKIILDAVAQFGQAFGWTYTQGTADYAVETIKNDGLVANGPDGVMGKFDMQRVADLITKAVPIYKAQGASPKDGVTPEDIVTNQFIDPSIGL
jgi:hypothetical protein